MFTWIVCDTEKYLKPFNFFTYVYKWYISNIYLGGARGVMVIVIGNGHSDTGSNPGQDWLHFT